MENRVPSIAQGQRILAAIMITDAVGFSARMSVDEGQTLRLIDRDLKLIAEQCDAYGGTLLKTTGDGLLMYFVSAVQAVSCGLEIQRRLVELAEELPTQAYLDHRIGIHLGDILVSEADVMGNGVNIAARLQTFAKPRELCISQTIFDVVKARLSLNATFLGPLQLKNIQEPVAAYQVSLTPPDPADVGENTTGESTRVVTVTPTSLLETAVQGLKNHRENRRAKKLIFAACQQSWENDETVLDQFELDSLLLSLRQRYPTLALLKAQLNRIVAGLNRKTTYLAVAEAVAIQLEPWYSCIGETTPLNSAAFAPDTAQKPLAAVAEALNALPEEQRVKKLLYCVCYRAWTNDPQTLSQYSLLELVQQTYELAPSIRDLKYQLGRIVKKLNRKGEYIRLANQIIGCFRPLFNGDEATSLSAPSGGESGDLDTTVTRISVPSSETPESTTLNTSMSVPGPTPPAAVAVDSEAGSARDLSNLFNLRQEIMRYTNPLRAKLLLYSCLHGPFGFTDQEWYTLRSQTLDQLLQETFVYCPTFPDLESKLTIIAHCLDNADENTQVASAVAHAMKPYYPVLQNPRQGSRSAAQAGKAAAPSAKVAQPRFQSPGVRPGSMQTAFSPA